MGETFETGIKQEKRRFHRVINWEEIGQRIAETISKMKCTQEDIAEKSTCTQGTISQYINARRHPPIEFLTQLSNMSGCSISWLLYGEEEAPPDNKDLTVRQMIIALHGLLRATGAKVTYNKNGATVSITPHSGIEYFRFPIRSDVVEGEQYNYTSWKTCDFLQTYLQVNNALSALNTDGGIIDGDSYEITKTALKEKLDNFINGVLPLTPKDAAQKESEIHSYDYEWGNGIQHLDFDPQI